MRLTVRAADILHRVITLPCPTFGCRGAGCRLVAASQGEVGRWKKKWEDVSAEKELLNKQAADRENVRRAFSYLSQGALPPSPPSAPSPARDPCGRPLRGGTPPAFFPGPAAYGAPPVGEAIHPPQGLNSASDR